MFITTKGYLLKRTDYQDFDEIITLINEYGNKFECYSLGSRKINSKNARNLDIGNYLEFQFFYSPQRLSKLKKITSLSHMDINLKQSYSLLVLNEYYLHMELGNKIFFDFYQKVIFYLHADINEYLLLLFICINIYKQLGYQFDLEKCKKCGFNQTMYIDQNDFGSVCIHCKEPHEHLLRLDNSYLELMKQIINNNIDLSLININQYDLKVIRHLVLNLMHLIYQNGGIFCSFMKLI